MKTVLSTYPDTLTPSTPVLPVQAFADRFYFRALMAAEVPAQDEIATKPIGPTRGKTGQAMGLPHARPRPQVREVLQ